MQQMDASNSLYVKMPDGVEMPLLERLREELRREDADIRSILSQVVEVLIRKETGEEVYDPFAGQSLYPVRNDRE